MTIPSTPSQVSYAGDGFTVDFPIPWVFDTSADIGVVLTDVNGNPTRLSTGYTVLGGSGSTGLVSFSALPSPEVGETVTLFDDPALTQDADYIDNDSFAAESHERALDRTVRQVKRLHQRVDRSIRVADGDLSDGDDLITPISSVRAGMFLSFDVNGNPVVSAGTGGGDAALRTDLASVADDNEGSRLVGAKYSTPAAVALNLQSYIDDDGAYQVMGFIPQNLKSAIRDATSTANVRSYLQAAIDAAEDEGVNAVNVRAGRYRCESALTGFQGLKLIGAGSLRSIIQAVGAINLFTHTGTLGDPLGGNLTFRDLMLLGSSSSLDLVSLTTAGQDLFERVFFNVSGASCLALSTECHRVTLRNCAFLDWMDQAVDGTLNNSVISIIDCQASIDDVVPNAGSAVFAGDTGEQITIMGLNVNGNGASGLYHVARFRGNHGKFTYIGNYGENLRSSQLITDSGVILDGAAIINNQLACLNSTSIDFSAGNPAHRGLFVRNARRPESAAGRYIANFGTGVVDFDYSGTLLDGSAEHLTNFPGQIAVRKFADTRIRLGAGTRHMVGPFALDNVAGTVGNTDITGTRFVPTRAGRVTAVVVKSTEARTAGTLTVNVFKNNGLSGAAGSAVGLSADLNGTDTITKVSTTESLDSAFAFAAGEEVWPKYSTSGWTPTTADIRVWIEVEM
jgi:hypothetical protein